MVLKDHPEKEEHEEHEEVVEENKVPKRDRQTTIAKARLEAESAAAVDSTEQDEKDDAQKGQVVRTF